MKTPTSDYILQIDASPKAEFDRLIEQNNSPGYKITDEIGDLISKIPSKSVILDAGSGAGCLYEVFKHSPSSATSKFYSFDARQDFLDLQRERFVEDKNLEFFCGRLEELPFEDETFDFIICRFVFQHAQEHQIIMDKFYRTLKSGGTLIVVDTDNLIYGLETESQKLKESMRIMLERIKVFSAYICRKIPQYMVSSGFDLKNLEIEPRTMTFYRSFDKEMEAKLCEKRFEACHSLLKSILGEKEGSEFIESYMDEFRNGNALTYYNKFVFHVKK